MPSLIHLKQCGCGVVYAIGTGMLFKFPASGAAGRLLRFSIYTERLAVDPVVV